MATRISSFIGATALLFAGTANAASIGFGPDAGDFNLDAFNGPADIELFLDLRGVTTFGGGVELAFSGGVSFVSFTPSAFFNTFDTNPSADSDFSGFGDPRLRPNATSTNPFELFIGRFDPFGGSNNSLGVLRILVSDPGRVQMVVSPRFGDFVGEDGNPLPGFGYGDMTVVPLPAAAWLFLTGMGFVGWRHGRKRA